jgi:dihydroorotate dehydrogenase
MSYSLIRPLLFRLDAERAHDLAMGAMAAGEAVLAAVRHAPAPPRDRSLVQRLWNIDFPNPVGLAAGFDKNGRAPHAWALLGFGFAELGTVTARPQPGNDRPRMFRYERELAVINRLGFNNDGAAAVARRLADLRARAPWPTPIGINIGKSRVVAVDDAVDDYVDSFRRLRFLADYVVVNVSSPNTPGLRELQDKDKLQSLLDALMRENAGGNARPLLVKVAPDLTDEALADIVAVARAAGVSGLVATNTTLDHGAIAAGDQSGGLSGAPLRRRSTEVIRLLRRAAGADLPIIGVGGVSSAADAYEKIRAGASLVQLYTGLIYRGPTLPRSIVSGLADLLRRDGHAHVSETVGADA